LAVAAPSLSVAQTAATNAPAAEPAPAVTPSPTPPAATTPVASTPAAADTGTARPETYTIVQGDTLWSISHKFNTSIHALQKLNGLKKHALLHIGQVIKIPPATADSSAK
jgi:LysM repeat protein